MTIKTRNILLISLLIVTIFPISLYLYSSIFLLSELNNSVFEFFYPELATRPVKYLIFSTGVMLLYSVVSSIVTFFYFRRTASTEIFFFLCFLATISFEALKPFSASFIAANMADYYILIFSKLIYFGYLLGSSFLLIGAFFSKGIDYKKNELIFALITITILYMVLKIPFYSMENFDNNFIFSPSLKNELFIGSILAVVSGAIIYLHSGIKQANKDLILAGVGYIMLITSRELILQLPNFNSVYVPTIFLLLQIPLILGTFLFVKKIHNIYLWY
ncbi:MAG: hypothetical protein JXR63_11145 [Spirochaetales bacterium]|nr:hypothetical protein [Spirochaetales bacterium]